MNKFRHRHFDIFANISFLPICVPNNQIFFHWKIKWKKKIYKSEYRAGNIKQWFCRAIKLFIILVKIYAAIMMEVTFEIQSNI